jgi:peroxisomal 2,4-dienoyl-CoA reductase
MADGAFQSDLLNGRAALITGGGTGICRGIALAFARHGCDVAITSRKIEHLAPTVAELRALGVRAIAKVADVRGNFICLAENLSPNGFVAVVDIDLKGTFNVSRAALPHLEAQGGSVINISATLPYLATMGRAHTSAAKAGGDGATARSNNARSDGWARWTTSRTPPSISHPTPPRTSTASPSSWTAASGCGPRAS